MTHAAIEARTDTEQVVQEYFDSAGMKLRSEASRGVLRGVKLLGLRSRNGRRYAEKALREAVGLYEGSKVNVNHPTRDPLAPRDYRDRLGVVRNVRFQLGDGLFGDLHYNPRHALAEQLAWDAEHAPENVGLSHNVLARTRRESDELVVEAITRVQSVDLVADPATTAGLFEACDSQSASPCGKLPGDESSILDDNARLRERVDHLEDQVARQSRRSQIDRRVIGLGLDADAAPKVLTEAFVRLLMEVDESDLDGLLNERVRMIQESTATARPRCREQQTVTEETFMTSTSDFVTAVLGRE